MMTNIVRLSQPQNVKRDRQDEPAPTQSADIVIFPGVRYERWDEDADTTVASAPDRGVRRDFIEL